MSEASLVRTALDEFGTLSTAVGIAKFAFERCAGHRREQFFVALQQGVQIEDASGTLQKSVDVSMNALIASEKGQEILFDAFRRVCFAKSRTYGPRIIGLLTAQLLNEGRKSYDAEDMIFAAAESLSDGEFSEFEKVYELLSKERDYDDPERGTIIISGNSIIHIREENKLELSKDQEVEIRTLPPSMRNSYGSWAAKMEGSGLIESELVQNHSIHPPSLSRLANTTEIHSKFVVTFTEPCLRLFDLLQRAKGIAHSA